MKGALVAVTVLVARCAEWDVGKADAKACIGLVEPRGGRRAADQHVCHDDGEVGFADCAADDVESAAHTGREGCGLTEFRAPLSVQPDWDR
jgi:hypothetical protein